MIRLNADVGEIDTAVFDGTQEALLDVVDEANVACGGHAGDERTMRATVAQCRARHVAIGAHPSYPDRANFGRTSMTMELAALRASIRQQVRTLIDVAGSVRHVKPHGALYHDAGARPEIVDVLVDVMREVAPGAALVLQAGAPQLERVRAAGGVAVVREGFADRGYRRDGSLIPRAQAGALLLDPTAAVAQALGFARANAVDTLCVHGDTPGAVALARAVKAAIAARS